MITNPPPIGNLYHYCPTESFFGIVTSSKLWLSNSEYANDPNENKIAYEILNDIAKNPGPENTGRFAEKVLETEFPLVDDMSAYVFCFSENEEDLNQWRVYADRGHGFMIGFRPQYFLDSGLWRLLDQTNPLPTYDKVFLSRCIYKYEQQRGIVEGLLQMFAEKDKPEELSNIVDLKHYLKFYSGIFKHQSYSVENEWRIVCFPIGQRQAPEVPVKYKLCFRCRRGVIIQYVEQEYLRGATMQNRPFDYVVLGSNVDNTPHEIGNFLQFHEAPWGRMWKSKLRLR